jgi:hypothetical protein
MKRIHFSKPYPSSKIFLDDVEFFVDNHQSDEPREEGALDIYFDFNTQQASVYDGQSWRMVPVKWEENGFSIDVNDLKS